MCFTRPIFVEIINEFHSNTHQTGKRDNERWNYTVLRIDARDNRHFLNTYLIISNNICTWWTRNIVYTNTQQLYLMWIAHQLDSLHKWYTKHDPWRCKCAPKKKIIPKSTYLLRWLISCCKSVSHLVCCAFNFYFVCKVYTVYGTYNVYGSRSHPIYWWNVVFFFVQKLIEISFDSHIAILIVN